MPGGPPPAREASPTAKSNSCGDLPNELIFLCSLEACQHIAIARWCGGKLVRLALALLNRRGVIGSLCGEVAASHEARRCRGPIRNRPTYDTHDRRESHVTEPVLSTLRTPEVRFSLRFLRCPAKKVLDTRDPLAP